MICSSPPCNPSLASLNNERGSRRRVNYLGVCTASRCGHAGEKGDFAAGLVQDRYRRSKLGALLGHTLLPFNSPLPPPGGREGV